MTRKVHIRPVHDWSIPIEDNVMCGDYTKGDAGDFTFSASRNDPTWFNSYHYCRKCMELIIYKMYDQWVTKDG